MIDFNFIMSDAPYNKHLLFSFSDGTVHSGMKVRGEWVIYPGQVNEIKGVSDDFLPLGVEATYGADAYFFNAPPIGWIAYD